MRIHIVPAWMTRSHESIGLVYDRMQALALMDQGMIVTYEPQERVCIKDRLDRPRLSCYMCDRGDSAYYLARN